MKRVSFKAWVPFAFVVEVFQEREKLILFDEIFLVEEFEKVT